MLKTKEDTADLGKKAVDLAFLAYESGRASAAPSLCDFRFVLGRSTYADVKIIGQPTTPKIFDRLISQLQLQRDLIAPDFAARPMVAGDL